MIKYAILGFVQGLTEFFPVSSKGHLVFLQHAFNMHGEEIVLPVVLHMGTLLAVVIYLRRELFRVFTDRRLLLLVLVPTAVTVVIALSGKKFFEGLFLRPAVVAPGMIVTGIVLLFTKNCRTDSSRAIGFRDAFLAGIAQSFAVIPGISRSGMTISSLLFRKLDAMACGHI
jgi:undecaprenyl-diphosphatase